MWVGAGDIFPDHRPLFVQFDVPCKQAIAKNWFIPSSWGDVPLDSGELERCYLTSRFRSRSPWVTNTDISINTAFQRWSKGVEHAVQQCIQHQHVQDPIRFPKPSLPNSFFGDVNQPNTLCTQPHVRRSPTQQAGTTHLTSPQKETTDQPEHSS